jgi:hypothetical protein
MGYKEILGFSKKVWKTGNIGRSKATSGDDIEKPQQSG